MLDHDCFNSLQAPAVAATTVTLAYLAGSAPLEVFATDPPMNWNTLFYNYSKDPTICPMISSIQIRAAGYCSDPNYSYTGSSYLTVTNFQLHAIRTKLYGYDVSYCIRAENGISVADLDNFRVIQTPERCYTLSDK
jgi:hypothetical protein